MTQHLFLFKCCLSLSFLFSVNNFRCHHLAEAAYTLCMTVLSSLPESPSEPSCYHTIEALLTIMLPTEEEWDLHDKQLPSKVCIVALCHEICVISYK